MPEVSDLVTLTLEPHTRLVPVATLVAGGIGGRCQMGVDRIDDLQLALTMLFLLLREDSSAVLEFDLGAGGIVCRLGPFPESVRELVPTVERLVSRAWAEEGTDGDCVVLAVDAAGRVESI